jgi:hypothetical protein
MFFVLRHTLFLKGILRENCHLMKIRSNEIVGATRTPLCRISLSRKRVSNWPLHFNPYIWRHDFHYIDTRHNDIQYNDTRHNKINYNYTQHKYIQHSDTQHNDTQRNGTQHNDTRHNDIQHDTRCGYI